jgi:hypothetical protein
MESTVKLMIDTLFNKGVTLSVSELGTNGLIGSAIAVIDEQNKAYIGGFSAKETDTIEDVLGVKVKDRGEKPPSLAYGMANCTLTIFDTNIAVGIVCNWNMETCRMVIAFNHGGSTAYLYQTVLLDMKNKSDGIYRIICKLCEKITTLVESKK